MYAQLLQHFLYLRKTGVDDAKASVFDSFSRLYRSRIHVKRHKPSLIPQLIQYQPAVTATAKSAVHIYSIRLYLQGFYRLIQ
jgi:hypothetical protein